MNELTGFHVRIPQLYSSWGLTNILQTSLESHILEKMFLHIFVLGTYLTPFSFPATPHWPLFEQLVLARKCEAAARILSRPECSGEILGKAISSLFQSMQPCRSQTPEMKQPWNSSLNLLHLLKTSLNLRKTLTLVLKFHSFETQVFPPVNLI